MDFTATSTKDVWSEMANVKDAACWQKILTYLKLKLNDDLIKFIF
jgi:hypothetical protein